MPDTHHVGAKPLPLPDAVTASAIYGGANNCYRYRLEWHRPELGTPSRTILWLMMNPSAASETGGDRTVLKCWRYSRAWGFNRMLVANSVAYRATDQARLAEIADPAGPDNIAHLLAMASEAEQIIAAYGKPKLPAARSYGPTAARALATAGHRLHVLALALDGTPMHPLYQPGDVVPQPWQPLLNK
jgi:hypothetical protein